MSTGFTFGAKTTGAPTFGTGSINFGTPQQSQPQQQQQQQFGFGAPASTAPSLFGTPTTTTASLGFKSPAFGFGSTTNQPSAGFPFAAAASSAPATGLAFGTPASSTPATGLAFGTPASSAPATGLAFGTPASSAPATGLGFGTPTASTGISFGTPVAAAATTAASGLGFGTPTASVGTGLSFGAPTTTAAGLSFGTPVASSGLSFGQTTSAPSTGLSFATNTSTAPTLGLNFGQTSTAGPTLNFSSTPATTTTGLSFGLGGIAATSTAAPATGFGLNLTSTTTAQQNVGLGGIPAAQSKTGAAAAAQKEVPPKEQPLPNELLQTVEQFKTLIQEEKNRSSEVARCSVKEFHKVENELDSLNYQLNQIENQLQTYRKLAEQLKYDTAKSLQNIEIAQRTQDTPPGLQYDNNAPLQFFIELTENFEREMQFLKTKIDNTEKYVMKCGESTVLTSQDLAVGLKQLHETFVALAGRMQSIHNQVEAQKDNFLSFRKQAYRDFVNPFERSDKLNETVNTIMKNTLVSPPKLASGPTPFNNIALGTNNVTLTTQQQQQNPLPATTTTALGFVGGNTTFGSFFGNQSNTTIFPLQQPPTGNKRGKQ